jgi:hypothetical protein
MTVREPRQCFNSDYRTTTCKEALFASSWGPFARTRVSLLWPAVQVARAELKPAVIMRLSPNRGSQSILIYSICNFRSQMFVATNKRTLTQPWPVYGFYSEGTVPVRGGVMAVHAVPARHPGRAGCLDYQRGAVPGRFSSADTPRCSGPGGGPCRWAPP